MVGPHVNKRTNTQRHSEETRAKIGVASSERAKVLLSCEYEGCDITTNKAGMTRHISSSHTFKCRIEDCVETKHKARGLCVPHWRIDSAVAHYGIDITKYYEMYEKQQGLCAICKTPGTRRRENLGRAGRGGSHGVLCVDHDHTSELTRSARGLVCNNCNLGLGHFKDNPALLLAAAQYLKEYQ